MKKLTTTILAFGICLASVRQASAGAQLRVSDGTPAGTIIITDDGPGDSANTTPGIIAYSGPVGPNWTISIAAGTSKPLIGSASSPALDLSCQAGSAGAGTLTIDFSDTGFTSGGAAVVAYGGTTAGTVTYNAWSDPANTNFGEASLIATLGPSTSSAFNDNATGTVPLSPLLSLTVETVIQHTGAGTSGFDSSLAVTPPACNCALTFNAPASLTNCAGDAIPDITASQDCGTGPTPVLVSTVSAVTNGTCPQTITRTVSATDTCGTTHTFIQNITVNCLPICTITPSVTTTIVGTTGLTASVTNAGPGATYVWNVLNGTITAGQGTPAITWTAGTDTNSPVSIVIKITAATGCENDCTASVKLTPVPPKIGLGSGDTATIGFWHNKNGQALINSAPNSPALANWLSSNFPCMFGSLSGKNNATVAALFLTDFGVQGQKTYAQVLGGALAAYFTSSTLAGTGAGKYGFNITPGGTGAKVFNVGSLGTTIGLQNNTSYTVLQILQAANANANCSNGTFNSAVFNALNTIFDGINSTGDIN